MIKTMIKKGFDNDKVDGRTLKAFVNIKKLLKKGENARTRTISCDEFQKIIENSGKTGFINILWTAYYTGMRAGEIRKVRYKHYDKKAGVFRLPKEITKENKAKTIPVIDQLKNSENKHG